MHVVHLVHLVRFNAAMLYWWAAPIGAATTAPTTSVKARRDRA
jgi:hypothetical protein